MARAASVVLALALAPVAAWAAEPRAADEVVAALPLPPKGQALDKERVREAIDRLVRGLDGGTARVVDLRIPEGLFAPEGSYTVEALAPKGGLRTGMINVPVLLHAGDETTRRVTIGVRLEVLGPVLVAVRDIARGTRLGPGDVRLDTKPIPAGGRFVTEPSALEHGIARVAIRQGQPIPATAVGIAAAVEPGQPVRALLRQGTVTLDLQTTSRGRGEIGAIVPVNGLGQRSLVRARVIGTGRVMILGSEEIEPDPTPADAPAEAHP